LQARRGSVDRTRHRAKSAPAWREGRIVTEADGGSSTRTRSSGGGNVVKVAGVTPIGLIGARHSSAELALAAGVRLAVVSRTLGHASSAFSADQNARVGRSRPWGNIGNEKGPGSPAPPIALVQPSRGQDLNL
jgi:hypothetical protein